MIPEKVRKTLSKYGLEAVEFEPGSTPTAELAARKFGVEVGQIAKSLLFIAKDGTPFIVICAGDRKIVSSKLKKITGKKSRMANAEETKKLTGFYPGGVCPFGIENIKIYIDKSLANYKTIYPAAGTDASGVPMTFEQLVEITGATICDVSVLPEET